MKSVYKKNKVTPANEITAPRSSVRLNFSLNIKTEAGIIKIGTIDIMVDAMPVVVCWTDSSEKDTPRKGPKKAPRVINSIALLFFTDCTVSFSLLRKIKMRVNPTIPVNTLIWDAAKGL